MPHLPRRALSGVAAFLLTVTGCTPSPGPDPEAAGARPAPAAVMGAVVAMNVSWGDWFSQGRADALAGMYTDDAVLMTPAGDVVGAEAIGQYLARVIAERPDSILATDTATETMDVAGDRAYEAGTVRYTLVPRRDPSATPRQEVVRYVTFWQQTPDGRWLIRRSLRSR